MSEAAIVHLVSELRA